MLFLAAITSSIAMLNPVAAFFREGLGLRRGAAHAMLGVIAGVGCLHVVYFSKDMLALDTLDFWAGTFLIVALALVQAIVYGWSFGAERGEIEAHRGARMRMPGFVRFILRYVSPLFLAAMLGWYVVVEMPAYRQSLSASRTAQYSVALIFGLAVMLLVMIYFAGRRWAAARNSPENAT
ncbi:MAG: hypothetical protein QM775_13635 [Pirellulales bacterium]